MFYCFIHNWYSSEKVCPACQQTLTSGGVSQPQLIKIIPESKPQDTFTWTDELVSEYVAGVMTSNHPYFYSLKSWKQWKQSKTQQPKEERIRVRYFCPHMNISKEHENGGIYQFNTSRPISEEKFQPLKEAIEKVLNNE